MQSRHVASAMAAAVAAVGVACLWVLPSPGPNRANAQPAAIVSPSESVSPVVATSVLPPSELQSESKPAPTSAVPPQTPDMPGPISIVAVSADSVQLRWDPSEGAVAAARYRVIVSGSDPVDVTGTAATVSWPHDTRQALIQVIAIDASGHMSTERAIVVTVVMATPSATPTEPSTEPATPQVTPTCQSTPSARTNPHGKTVGPTTTACPTTQANGKNG